MMGIRKALASLTLSVATFCSPLPYLRDATNKNPQHGYVWYQFGRALFGKGDYTEAIKAFLVARAYSQVQGSSSEQSIDNHRTGSIGVAQFMSQLLARRQSTAVHLIVLPRWDSKRGEKLGIRN